MHGKSYFTIRNVPHHFVYSLLSTETYPANFIAACLILLQEKLPTAEVVLGYNQGIDEGANIGGNIGGSYGGAAGSYGIGGIGSGSGYGSYSYGPVPGQGNSYGSLRKFT